jgi:3-oxoacyl-[acyl-carrier-protein] synthase I
MRPIAVVGSGMMTGVGLNAAASCAAIRCAINSASETTFADNGGEWILGCEVPLDEPIRGLEKLVILAAAAVTECLQGVPVKAAEIPILLCVSEKDRPGRLDGLDDELLPLIQEALKTKTHAESRILNRGRVGTAHALKEADRLLFEKKIPYCIILGVDTYLQAETLRAFEARDRLLTSVNSNGFIPGEAAAAVLLGPAGKSKAPELRCKGLGFGTEKAPVESGQPLRADGLVEAYRAALADGACTFEDVHYRLADVNGEQYGFKEAQLAIGRTIRGKLKPEFPIWHPADCIGEVGAAMGPCMLGVALMAARKGYAPGDGALLHLGTDGGERAAIILKYEEPKT